MKKLLLILLVSLAFVEFTNGQEIDPTDSDPILFMRYIPTYMSLKTAYKWESPILKITQKEIVYLNIQEGYYEAQLSEEELKKLTADLDKLGLFTLTMDTLREAAMDDVIDIDGTKTILFYKFDNYSDSLTFGTPDRVPDSLLWKNESDLDVFPWRKLYRKVARIQTYLYNFRPAKIKPYKGSMAAIFLDCKNTHMSCTGRFMSTSSDSFFVESYLGAKEGQRWPLDDLPPTVSSTQSFKNANEIKITSPNILDKIRSLGIKSGNIYRYKDEIFAVYFRPLF